MRSSPATYSLVSARNVKNRLKALVAFILRVIPFTSSHLVAEQRVHRRVGIQNYGAQSHVGRFPNALAHAPLHLQQLIGYAAVQRGQEPPERTLRREPQHAQDSRQHGLALKKPHVMQSRETHVAGQHHRQNELIRWHRPSLPLHSQGLFHQLLEPEFLQQRAHGKQSSVGGQIFAIEVIGRGRADSIRFWRGRMNPLIDGRTAIIL